MVNTAATASSAQHSAAVIDKRLFFFQNLLNFVGKIGFLGIIGLSDAPIY
jgi:hypothetical protein